MPRDWALSRIVLFVLGTLCLGLAIVGMVLPVLPTTPFLLLTAVCYSRASARMHHWLLSHPRFGPPLRDWREHGVIRTRAKVIASTLIVVGFAATILNLDGLLWLKVLLAVTGAAALLFILTRPSSPDHSSSLDAFDHARGNSGSVSHR